MRSGEGTRVAGVTGSGSAEPVKSGVGVRCESALVVCSINWVGDFRCCLAAETLVQGANGAI